MKKAICTAIILAGMASMLTTSCTQSASVTPLVSNVDSVSKGSSFSISYYNASGNLVSYSTKDASFGGLPVVQITTSVNKVDSVNNIVAINVLSPYATHGVTVASFYLLDNGSGTGTFSFSSPSSYGKVLSEFAQTNPDIVFTDSSGSATITYDGPDYIEGTFTTAIYTGTVTTYNASGSFKVVK